MAKKKWTAEEIMATENAAAKEQQQAATDYQALAKNAMDSYNTSKFGYDVNSDPLYKAAAELYRKQGELGAKDVQARAAQYTGGYGNSYGAMAAQQQYNAAAEKIAALAPEFEANAYNKYQDEQNARLKTADYYQGLADSAYAKGRDAASDARYAESSVYERNETEEKQEYDRQKAAETQAWNIALQKAQVGDYSGLEALGVNTSSQRMQENLERAAEWAKYGDYSLLKALGIDTSALEATAAGSGSTGSTGGTGKSSSGSSSKTSSGGTTATGQDSSQTNKPVKSLKTADEYLKKTDPTFKNNGYSIVIDNLDGTYVVKDKSGNYYDAKYDPKTGEIQIYG